MKTLLDGLRAVHSDRRVAGPARDLNASNAKKLKDDAEWRETANVHPVVRTHPETHRKALYVNRQSTIAFEDMTEDESKPLLDYLCQHAHRPSSLAVSLEEGLGRLLGQPVRAAHGHQRHRHVAAGHAATADRRRQAVLISSSRRTK
jgi:taurine dioxygenase